MNEPPFHTFPVISIDDGLTTDDVNTLDGADIAESTLEAIIASIEHQLKDENNDDKTWRFNAQKALRMKRIGLQIVRRKRAVIKRAHRESLDQKFILMVKDHYPDIFDHLRKQVQTETQKAA